jgi:hypothetical protein
MRLEDHLSLHHSVLSVLEAAAAPGRLEKSNSIVLEFDIGRLQQADYETQCYWVAAVVAARTAIYGPDQPTDTPTQQPPLWRREHKRMLQEPLHWTHGPVKIQPTRSRPSPSVRFALEASNIARKPD